MEGAVLRPAGEPEVPHAVADKFDLRKHMQFNCTVDSMRWDDVSDMWHVHIAEGDRELTSRFEFSEYLAERIRRRVKDPVIAEKLIPKDHGFGVQRVPMETNYFEVYNQDNVELVDISATPIERITAKGVKTTDAEREFDIIVYATGFDAITGGYDRIDITGAKSPGPTA